jgi:D-alanyl-D-alanine carboxypeptidase
VLHDPAGLDDEFSVGGGNLISARDLAIASRAVLAEPRLAEFVGTREYRFFGGDGIHHKLINHNQMLRTHPGTVGVKTGYTERSGRCLIAAATREGRTLIAVVVDVYDMYGFAAAQLDRGFALGPVRTGAVLPAVPTERAPAQARAAARPTPQPPPTRTSFGERVRDSQDVLAVVAGCLALAYFALRARRRHVWRQRARRRARGYPVRPTPDRPSRGAHFAGSAPGQSPGGTAGDQW